MPFELQIIRTLPFVRMDIRGRPDLSESESLLTRLADSCISAGVCCALLDARPSQAALSTTELYQLAQALPTIGLKQEHRLAILHRFTTQHADTFAAFATDRGWRIRAFGTYEEAVEWFSTTEPIAANG